MSGAVRRPAATVLVLAGVLLVLVGVVGWLRPAAPTAQRAVEPAPAPAHDTPAADAQRRPDVVRPERVRPTRAGVPRRLALPSLSVAAPVLPVRTSGAVLTPPADPATIGWWAQGARPGAARGTALLTGHTVHSGGGALDDLDRVDEGDPVLVDTSRGRLEYVVTRVAVLDTDELARAAGRLFRQRGPGRLVLVTCEGWDGEQYRSNAVVVAVPPGE